MGPPRRCWSGSTTGPTATRTSRGFPKTSTGSPSTSSVWRWAVPTRRSRSSRCGRRRRAGAERGTGRRRCARRCRCSDRALRQGSAAGRTRAGVNQRRTGAHRHDAAQVLSAVEPPDLARLGRRHEVQRHLKEAVETFGTAGMRAGVQRQRCGVRCGSRYRRSGKVGDAAHLLSPPRLRVERTPGNHPWSRPSSTMTRSRTDCSAPATSVGAGSTADTPTTYEHRRPHETRPRQDSAFSARFDAQ